MSGVTVSDTVRWLHDEGLARLAGVGEQSAHPVVAFTIDVATGTVGVHPASGAASEVRTVAADDLPRPVGSSKRLVVVGVTTSEAMLVVDLAQTPAISINADRPEDVARSWVLQLLLNPDITIATNSAEVAIDHSSRCRRSFIPGGGASVINVDDQTSVLTTVTLNATMEGPDHLDVEYDGSGELYLGSRFWSLRQVMTVGDSTWAALSEQMSTEPSEQMPADSTPEPAPTATIAPPAGAVAAPPRGAFAPDHTEIR
ncbi:MAG: hypothetical protein J2P18_17825 [Nocardia sp.]|nr:hypothetical protein [Nocardia sp.]